MIDAKIRGVIDAIAACVGLPDWEYRGETYPGGLWWEGLLLGESSGDFRARRYEAHQDRGGDADTPNVDDGKNEDDASRGLTQLMGYNAVALLQLPERCKHGDPILYDFSFLELPVINLALGVRILLGELATVYRLHPNVTKSEMIQRALCRYNGGNTGDAMVNGDFRLRGYVDHVEKYAKIARENRRLGR